jgi:hypothetical protein
MRRKLVAAVLSMAVMVPAVSIQPAQAETASTQDLTKDIQDWINVASSAWNLIKGVLGAGGPSIADAIAQISAKIEAAKTEILTHIDAIATAEAKACARHAVVEFADVNLFNPDVLQRWTQDVTACAISIDSLIGTVTDKGQKDQLGLALNIAGPIAIAARIKAGFSTSLLVETIRHGQNAIISALFPTCRQWTVVEPPTTETVYRCVAYNGDWAEGYYMTYRGRPIDPPINKPAVENQSTRNTSRAVAQAILPVMP